MSGEIVADRFTKATDRANIAVICERIVQKMPISPLQTLGY